MFRLRRRNTSAFPLPPSGLPLPTRPQHRHLRRQPLPLRQQRPPRKPHPHRPPLRLLRSLSKQRPDPENARASLSTKHAPLFNDTSRRPGHAHLRGEPARPISKSQALRPQKNRVAHPNSGGAILPPEQPSFPPGTTAQLSPKSASPKEPLPKRTPFLARKSAFPKAASSPTRPGPASGRASSRKQPKSSFSTQADDRQVSAPLPGGSLPPIPRQPPFL